MKYTITRIKGGTDNCYIISNGDNAILFDTASGKNLQKVKDACSKYNMKLIVLSHPHFDHAENAEELSKYFNIPVAYNEQDDNIFDDYRSQPLKSHGLVGFIVLKMSLRALANTKVMRPVNKFFVKEGDTLGNYGFPDIKVVELPGHSKGSIGLLVSDDAFLVGDALDNWINPGVGHLYTDIESLKKSAEKIRSYGKRTYYYGHGKPTEKKR